MAAFQESTADTVTIVAGLESTFADELGALTVPWQGAAAPDPQLLVVVGVQLFTTGLVGEMLVDAGRRVDDDYDRARKIG